MLRVIGRGSYAKVLLVEQKSSKRVYAMKVIKKELVNDDEVRTEKPIKVCKMRYIFPSSSFPNYSPIDLFPIIFC